MSRPRLGLFGGTFDPVHTGHLRSAIHVCDALALERVDLVPCGVPPHRVPPAATAEARLQMARLAIEGQPALGVEEYEIRRTEPCFTARTLLALRHRYGAEASLTWCVGMDAFCQLESWYQWRSLFQLAHIAVLTRPGFSSTVPPALSLELARRQLTSTDKLHDRPHGSIVVVDNPEIDISATALRSLLQNRSPEAVRWLAPAVQNYIEQNRLYRSNDN